MNIKYVVRVQRKQFETFIHTWYDGRMQPMLSAALLTVHAFNIPVCRHCTLAISP